MTMMATALDIVSEIRSHFPLIWDIATAFATLMAVFVVVFFLELRFGGDLRRYKTRNFLTDSLYALFYQAGIRNRFVQVPVLAAIALVRANETIGHEEHVSMISGQGGFQRWR